MLGRALRTAACVSASIAFVLGLSACTAGPAADAGTSPTLTPEAGETQSEAPSADPLADVAVLVVHPETIDLNDANGDTLLSVSYAAPAAEMVDALTEAVGFAPEVREHDGGLESPPGVLYEWPGLTVSDPEPVDGTFPELTNLQLMATAPSVGALSSIETVQGYSVGSETAPIMAENMWTVPEFASFHFPAEFGPELGAPSGDNPDYLNAWAVSMSSEPPATTITLIFAPVNFGVSGH